MPYYCTVPRCTSMAGKAKNVSFHQFPRDEELAKLWNKILKRGKPYTKYSKVCSLHFTPDDYTMSSGQKNKGQWRTLRKDAIPSRNLPFETPVSYDGTPSWSQTTPVIDARMHQQMAQAIYVQTMLAMQAAGVTEINPLGNDQQSAEDSDSTQIPPPLFMSQLEQILARNNQESKSEHSDSDTERQEPETNLPIVPKMLDTVTYKCTQCSKCFKDPDVFILHKRSHAKHQNSEKENSNTGNTQETLRANPILANLLKSNVPQTSVKSETEIDGVFDVKNVKSIENQIMAALTANMENYLRNLSTIMTHGNTANMDNVDSTIDNSKFENVGEMESQNDVLTSDCDSKDLNDSCDSNLVIDESAES